MSFRLRSFSAVFTVRDVAAVLAFYVGRLGFTEQFRSGDPPSYASIERDMVSIQLMPMAQSPDTLGLSTIYVFVDGADALHEALLARGAAIELAPAEIAYGMHEMSLRDPDGNRITFGQAVRA
jgi:uncharacterized glyoxalase superfamily protein PhnB